MNARASTPAKKPDQAPPQNAVVVFDAARAGADLVEAVNARKPQLASLLGVDPESERGKVMLDRFMTVALHAATSRPDILRATKESLVESIRDAAMFGLEPVGATGDGSIVVYQEKRKELRTRGDGSTFEIEVSVPTAHFQPMYRGLLKLARRSDEIAYIDAAVVFAGDIIELEGGSDPFVRHVPAIPRDAGAKPIMVYAVAELSNGKKYVDWMTQAEIEVSRKQSRAKDAMAWTSFWTEMARKTILRRLMKRLPLETLAENALRIESEAEQRASGEISVSMPPEAPARDRLRARLGRPVSAPLGLGDGAAAPTGDSSATKDAPEGESAVSVDPSGGEDPGPASEAGTTAERPKDEVEGESRVIRDSADGETVVELCLAKSDEQLGPVETCILPADHANPNDGKPTAHEGKDGGRWPNR